MNITFDVDGVEEIDKKFDKWRKQFSKPKDILEEFGKRELTRTKKRFDKQRGPDGQPWAAWSAEYLERRIREGTASFGILVSSGALFRSLDYQVRGNSVSVGSPLEYAEYMQEGTNDIPARPFLGFNDRSEADIAWLFNTILKGKPL